MEKLFLKILLKNFGKEINQDKEGTRNYSIKISNKIFWDFNKFEFLKKYKIDKETFNNEKKSLNFKS